MNRAYLIVFGLLTYYLNLKATAQTWTQTNGSLGYIFNGVAMSANGCKLAATTSETHAIYSSTDGGNTWQTNQGPTQDPDLGCTSIALSADGTKWIASKSLFANAPFVYVSTNSGSNWTGITEIAGGGSVSSSALGNILTVASYSGYMYVSTNSGLTWTTNTLGGFRSSVVSSADGTKLAAAPNGSQIYVSTNFGTTWTATQSPAAYWTSLACSADGTNLIASAYAGTVTGTYISTNFGGKWRLASKNAGLVASSADGTKLIVVGTGNGVTPNLSIYTSSNGGVTWVSNNIPALGWASVACSADGSEFVAADIVNGIWIGRTTPSPQMNLQLTNSNLVLSWLVPSTTFVVQQNSDLTMPNWVTLTNTPSFVPLSLQNQVTLPYSNTGPGFFRLSAQ
jgi:hypothetical protein